MNFDTNVLARVETEPATVFLCGFSAQRGGIPVHNAARKVLDILGKEKRPQ